MSDANKARSGNTWPASGGGSTGKGQGSGSGSQGMTDTAQQAKDKLAGTAKEAESAAKETAQEAMSTTRETVSELADQTQQQASEVISQVSEQVTATVGDVKQQATTTFTEQRDRAAGSLSALAKALRETGRNLESENSRQGINAQDQGGANIAPFIDEAADRLAQAADFLKDKDMGGLFDEAQRLARKQPGLFVASMFGIGLVGARLLKGAVTDEAGGQQGWQGSGSSGQSGSGSSYGSGFQSGSTYGVGSQASDQSWGQTSGSMASRQGSSGSMPSGHGGSSIGSSTSGPRDATQGQSANALTGEGLFSDAGPGTTTYAPSDSTRTGYEHAGSGSGSGSSNQRPGSAEYGSTGGAQRASTPGAGWAVDDATRSGESVNTDTRLQDHPDPTVGSGTTGGSTSGSAMSGYGAFDADSFADEDRADAVTGGDHTRHVGRSEGERS